MKFAGSVPTEDPPTPRTLSLTLSERSWEWMRILIRWMLRFPGSPQSLLPAWLLPTPSLSEQALQYKSPTQTEQRLVLEEASGPVHLQPYTWLGLRRSPDRPSVLDHERLE